jgi:hypothetical protein
VEVAVGDAPELLDEAVVEGGIFVDVGQKAVKHGDMGGEGVSAHGVAAACGAESVESGSFGGGEGVVAAGVPGEEEEVFLVIEDLVLVVAGGEEGDLEHRVAKSKRGAGECPRGPDAYAGSMAGRRLQWTEVRRPQENRAQALKRQTPILMRRD